MHFLNWSDDFKNDLHSALLVHQSQLFLFSSKQALTCQLVLFDVCLFSTTILSLTFDFGFSNVIEELNPHQERIVLLKH